MRKTVHLIASDDAGWMLPLFEPAHEKWSRTRLGQLGMPDQTQQRAMGEVARALDAEGPMTRNALRQWLRSKGIELDQQTGLHVVGLATVSGIACQGPDIGASPSLVRREEWLGKPPRFDRDKALAELARRYLRGFGRATDRDFARWSGLALRELRKGLEAIAGELTETRVGEEIMLSLKGAAPRLPRRGRLRLLGAFDTYLLGYASRDFLISAGHGRMVNAARGGMIEPAIARDGEILGLWTMSRSKKRLEIRLDPFEPLGAAELEAIDAEVADIGRFEGLEATLG